MYIQRRCSVFLWGWLGKQWFHIARPHKILESKTPQNMHNCTYPHRTVAYYNQRPVCRSSKRGVDEKHIYWYFHCQCIAWSAAALMDPSFCLCLPFFLLYSLSLPLALLIDVCLLSFSLHIYICLSVFLSLIYMSLCRSLSCMFTCHSLPCIHCTDVCFPFSLLKVQYFCMPLSLLLSLL